MSIADLVQLIGFVVGNPAEDFICQDKAELAGQPDTIDISDVTALIGLVVNGPEQACGNDTLEIGEVCDGEQGVPPVAPGLPPLGCAAP